MCRLFSGDVDGFFEAVYSREFRRSQIGSMLHETEPQYHKREFKFVAYTGLSKPFKSNDVFTLSPILGIGMGGPIAERLIVDLAIKFRININDENFYYYALGDTNNVNSDESIFFGGIFRYSLYDKEKLRVSSDFGIGLESISTGLSEEKKNSTDKDYYNVKTIHLSIGISGIIPLYRNNSLGLGLNYHYCPYQLDKNLITAIDNDLVSLELFWKF